MQMEKMPAGELEAEMVKLGQMKLVAQFEREVSSRNRQKL